VICFHLGPPASDPPFPSPLASSLGNFFNFEDFCIPAFAPGERPLLADKPGFLIASLCIEPNFGRGPKFHPPPLRPIAVFLLFSTTRIFPPAPPPFRLISRKIAPLKTLFGFSFRRGLLAALHPPFVSAPWGRVPRMRYSVLSLRTVEAFFFQSPSALVTDMGPSGFPPRDR